MSAARLRLAIVAFILVPAEVSPTPFAEESDVSTDGINQQTVEGIWSSATDSVPPSESARSAASNPRFKVRLDDTALDQVLESASHTDGSGAILPLPLPDGTFARFRLEPMAVPPAQAPAMRAFRARSLSGGLAARIERTSAGLHAVVTGPGDPVFVDPAADDPGIHVSYRARDAGRPLVAGGALPLAAVRRIEAVMAEKAMRTPAQRRIGSRLLEAAWALDVPSGLDTDDTGRVLVDITVEVSPELLQRIVALGGTVIDAVPRYRAVRARLPPGSLEALAEEGAVTRIESADVPVPNANSVHREGSEERGTAIRSVSATGGSAATKENTSEGDAAHAAAAARERFGVDGAGIGIGVLSNGVGTLAERQATGDLPSRVTVLPGQEGADREGTAMLEIVHDLAPGAHLYFATAIGGQARFAANIEALCEAGADVIVDDIYYFTEGAFQDDVVARGINAASEAGCFYFTLAGNLGQLDAGTSGVWEGDFSAAQGDPPPGVEGVVHDFGGADSNEIENLGHRLQLKWVDPLGASANDYDLYLFDETMTELLASSTDSQQGGRDPYEWIPSAAATEGARLVVVKSSGEDRYLRLNTLGGRLEHATAGQIFGHSGARSAVTTAAVDARTAGGADGAFDGSESVEDFSSDGPRRLFFEPDGTPITPGDFRASGGERVQKPDIAAADGVTTATPGFEDFHGTSAAAPHAAAIAALALQSAGGPIRITMEELRAAMVDGALDIGVEGADRTAGAGIVMAPVVLDALHSGRTHHAPTLETEIGDRTLISLADPDEVDLDAHFDDADGDALSYRAYAADAAIAGVEIAGSALSLAPGVRGSTVVMVRATDPGGLTALTSFAVTVEREWGQTDYDIDDDGLIEIGTLEQLSAVRHDLDGNSVEDSPEGVRPYFAAFPDAARDMGCGTGCRGFELTRDLDFDDPSSYASGKVDRGWSASEGGSGWEPIGTLSSTSPLAGRHFDADFFGNGHSVRNLFIRRPESDGVGLFGLVGGTRAPNKAIMDVEVVDVVVTGRDYVGGLVGAHDETREQTGFAEYWNRSVDIRGVGVSGRVSGRNMVGGIAGFGSGRIAHSFAAAQVSGGQSVGGLVGESWQGHSGLSFGTIAASYATGPVSGDINVGGLIGSNSGTILACYATGMVEGNWLVGGLVGSAYGPVSASYAIGLVRGTRSGGLFGFVTVGTPLRGNYWDVETSGNRVGVGSDDHNRNGVIDGAERFSAGVDGRTTEEMTAPGSYAGIYAGWNADLDWDSRGYRGHDRDDPWHFGDERQYPALRGRAAAGSGWREFGRQLRESPRLSLAASSGHVTLTWTEPGKAYWDPPPTVVYNVYRNTVLVAEGVDGATFRDIPPADGTAAYAYQVAAAIGQGEPVRSNIATIRNRPPFAPFLANRIARTGESFEYAFEPGGDPDGDVVMYTVPGTPGWLTFDPSSPSFSGTPGDEDVGTARIRVTATDSGTPPLSSAATFSLTVNRSRSDNNAPEPMGTIVTLSMVTGESETVHVVSSFEDPDGDALAFEASVLDADVAAVRVQADAVTVAATAEGVTTVTVIASDGELEAKQSFAVEVRNSPPHAVGSIGERRLTVPGPPAVLDAAAHFEDPDGDALTYAAVSSDPEIVVIEAEGPGITLSPVAAGSSTVTVSATDRDGSGSTAKQAVFVVAEADYDADDDNLIEVRSVVQLDAIRHDLDGDGIVAKQGKLRHMPYADRLASYAAAYPQPVPGMGCPAGCLGYELAADLDFDTDRDGHASPGDAFWNGGAGWDPLGGYIPDPNINLFIRAGFFDAVFEGNGHTISGLFIDRPKFAGIGLFGYVTPASHIRNVELADVEVAGRQYVGGAVGQNWGLVSGIGVTGRVAGGHFVGGLMGANEYTAAATANGIRVYTTGDTTVGGLAGYNWGKIRDARAAGDVAGTRYSIGGLVGVNSMYGSVTRAYATGDVTGEEEVGGLAGTNDGLIAATYVTGTSSAPYAVGGLVGHNSSSGKISASYVSTSVRPRAGTTERGGLVGRNGGTITAGYSERHSHDGVSIGSPLSHRESRTTADLQMPSGYTGIYRNWSLDLDGDGQPDDPWTFESGSYPALQLDSDGDGVAAWREFGPQRGPVGVRVAVDGAQDGRILVTWYPPVDTAGTVVVGYEVQRRVGDSTFVDADPPHAGTETEYADDAPPDKVSHTYRVRAVTDAGATGWSAPASTAPGAPVLVATPGIAHAVLTWTDPVDSGTSAIIGYQYQGKPEEADAWDPPWTDVPHAAAAARSFEVDGLANGTAYGFELRAVNASGPGPGSARAVVTPSGAPGAPRDLHALVTNGQVALRWKAPENRGSSELTGYQFRQSADNGSSWMPDWTPVPGGNVEEHTVAGLANAATYVFEVRAINESGPGPAARVYARTPPVLAMPIPALAFAAHGDDAMLDLGKFFAVAPGGVLSYEAWSLNPDLVRVRVRDGQLLVLPNDGTGPGETPTTRTLGANSAARVMVRLFTPNLAAA